MAIQVMVRAASAMHKFALTAADELIAEVFPDSRFWRAIWHGRLAPHSVVKEDFLDAAQSHLVELRQQWTVLPYRYSFECRMPVRDEIIVTRGSGGVHGIPIGGRIHTMWGGAGKCYLEEWEAGADGLNHVVRVIDVRGRKRLETDTWGTIKISRRRLDTTLPEQLDSLVRFLGQISEAEVEVFAKEGASSVMDLVRQSAEGEDAANEELYNRGEPAKQELMRRIDEGKPRKHVETMAWLVLTMFPSTESRAVVEQAAEREKGPERRKSLLALLASTKTGYEK